MMKKLLSIMTLMLLFNSLFYATALADRERVLIYSSCEEYRNAHFQKRLNEQFPDYDVVIEYMSTGNQAAKIMAEGTQTQADILYDMESGYYDMLEPNMADLSSYDRSKYAADVATLSDKFLTEVRNGGAILVNTDVLKKYDLKKPENYNDLLDPAYKGLISMPNPKSSGTGYMFLLSLVNAWGEDEALDYFDSLNDNILQYTSSGSGPVNALVQGEVAIGLGMIAQAVTSINEGAPLDILFFTEGAPYSIYGFGIVEGKQNRACVREVFDFFYNTLVDEDKALYFPEQIYKNKTFEVTNYPTDIRYADMSGNTSERKQQLLSNWEY